MDGTTGTTGDKDTGWRGSAKGWLNAARRAFVENGLDAVKIQPLAAQLNLSRTSFYWFFKDRAALLDALLAQWEAQNTGAFTAACEGYAETIAEGVLNLIAVFLDEGRFDPQFDFAVRGWAHQSDAVMARVNAADEARMDAIRAMFRRFGYSAADADVRARAVYLVQIGYIALQTRESVATRLERAPGYVEIYTGTRPTENEVARFRAKVGAG